MVSLEALHAALGRGEKVKYLYFWGHQKPKAGIGKSCFSQWYQAPFDVDGRHYPTAEHYMMARKALLFKDQSAFEKILAAATPGEAKKLGRNVMGFDDKVWQKQRFAIVVEANLAKFSQLPELKAFLLDTGERVLVEASPVDNIWGVGLAADDMAIEDPANWQGLNLLGFALMAVRERLNKELS
ncbi:NADAR family protein [Thalassomonas sp. RHCl1]|uniref:NADAR family protein n=1 Tax=Thalassomonas sp. RHCl1 TaxID=2995320 RepID=UPI00248CBF6C|nr:NADAR family protein [Thalassomonas sp. RHCl1]